jgi:hypothetical protein
MFDIDKGFARLLEEDDVLYEHVLYMVAEASWKRRLAQGVLKRADIRRIQKARGGPDPLYIKQLLKQGKDKLAQAHLKKKGIVKSAREWLVGVEKGTQNILKKYKVKVLHKPDVSVTRMATASGGAEVGGLKVGKTMRAPLGAHAKIKPGGGKRRIHVASGVKKKEYGMATQFKRHEAGEIQSAVKQSKSKLSKGTIMPLKPEYGHMSDEVLRKERELTRTSKALYGKKAGGKQISKMRKQSGEYAQLGKRGKKEIAKSEKELRKNMIHMIRTQKKELKNMKPADRKEWLASIKQQVKSLYSKKDVKGILRQFKDVTSVNKRKYVRGLQK